MHFLFLSLLSLLPPHLCFFSPAILLPYLSLQITRLGHFEYDASYVKIQQPLGHVDCDLLTVSRRNVFCNCAPHQWKFSDCSPPQQICNHLIFSLFSEQHGSSLGQRRNPSSVSKALPARSGFACSPWLGFITTSLGQKIPSSNTTGNLKFSVSSFPRQFAVWSRKFWVMEQRGLQSGTTIPRCVLLGKSRQLCASLFSQL